MRICDPQNGKRNLFLKLRAIFQCCTLHLCCVNQTLKVTIMYISIYYTCKLTINNMYKITFYLVIMTTAAARLLMFNVKKKKKS